ncbi:hypothetical protein H6P81_004627 [Aristolochia fimbriata]|uniref:Uncharacterized protein n=1 Tax=Aristolochia fimbriata TaxID=158543 RepID=A0AAV7ESP6_ARIFI|nr:hypothetical protein H6P81_004627 [Aristolochia fimbriata]
MATASMAIHALVGKSALQVKGSAGPQSMPRGTRAGRFAVRCQQGEGRKQSSPDQEQPSTQMQSSTTPPPAPAPAPSPPPKTPSPKAAASTSFFDVLAFSGPAPERINGRLAMIGFVAALGAELAKGDSVVAQLSDGGLPWFVGATAVLSLASLIPLFKGVSVQSKSEGLMNADAELWNGRFAMLGIVALVFTEYLKGGALV